MVALGWGGTRCNDRDHLFFSPLGSETMSFTGPKSGCTCVARILFNKSVIYHTIELCGNSKIKLATTVSAIVGVSIAYTIMEVRRHAF